MTRQLDPAALARIADRIEARLDALPGIDSGTPERLDATMPAHRRALQALVNDLVATEHAQVRGDAIAMHGLRASSTMGFGGALRNWINQARARVAAARPVVHAGGEGAHG